jgi:DNA-binding IclR family transcriptional regulator
MGGRCVFMHVKSGERSDWQHEEIGEQLYLHNTAVGKAILSTMSDEKVQSVIEQWGLPQTTESTITDTAELKEEVERTRKRGYAINRGENIEGLYALGVPIVGHEDEIIGGISMSGPRTILPEYAENTDHLEKLQYEREEFELELKLS